MPRRRRRKTRFRSRVVAGLRLLAMVAAACVVLLLALVLPWRVFNPPVTTFMLQQTTADQRDYRPVPGAQISRYAPLAAVASEDQRFLLHHGVDISAIRQALGEGGAKRGASTITQQLVKNLYLWPGRSLFRKGVEAILAFTFDALVPMRRILELYLNVVEFGPGIYGVAAASQRYLGKSPDQINRPEAALLVVALPNPKAYKVSNPSAYMRERQSWVLMQMNRLEREGLLTELGW